MVPLTTICGLTPPGLRGRDEFLYAHSPYVQRVSSHSPKVQHPEYAGIGARPRDPVQDKRYGEWRSDCFKLNTSHVCTLMSLMMVERCSSLNLVKFLTQIQSFSDQDKVLTFNDE